MDFSSITESIKSGFGELNPLLRCYEREWVDDTCRILDEEDEECGEQVPVRIFTAPKALVSLKQEAYIPQFVAIGPYHQKRLDLYQMMRYKISSAKRTQKILKSTACISFRDVVGHFCVLEHRIRASYHMFIDYSGETLAWTMAIDASFLLEFLHIYTKGLTLTKIPRSMSHLVDYTGRKSGQQAILKDIIMMENQIPLFVLRDFLRFCQIEKPDEYLAEALKGLCKDLSPIKQMNNFFPSCKEEVFERAHLLELLYYTLVPASSNDEEMVVVELHVVDQTMEQKLQNGTGESDEQSSQKKSLNLVMNKLSDIMRVPIRYLNKAATSKTFSVVVKLPYEIIKKITRSSSEGNKIQVLVALAEEVAQEVDMVESETKDSPPIIDEEIQIPSVTELKSVGIRFRPSKGGLNTIKFDKATATFNLPVVVMNEQSEVVMRNLAAYEGSIAPEMMTFSRYIELMNGIIDTEEDVKLLREEGIILSRRKSDMEVANLWNGMSKSAEPTRVPVLDEAIESVNAHYSSKLKVKAEMIMKKSMFGSWKFLIFFGANILLLVTALQAFCSVYNCKRTFSSA